MPKKARADMTLAETLADLRKNDAPIGTLKDFDMTARPLSTGNIALDAITGVGGLPRGRVIELFGMPSSGKTTTALQTAALVQQTGGNVVYLDYERSLDEAYCTQLGLDVNDPSFIYIMPESFEQGANLFRRLLQTGEVDLMICDSVARMVTESELNADTGKAVMADRAKMMHQFLRQITNDLQKYDCAAVFLNHVQDVVDASPIGQKLKAQGINRKTTPGGTALKFYASMRIEFKQVGNIRGKVDNLILNETADEMVATKVQATVVKNKVAKPFGVAEVRNRYGEGFSQEWSVLDILVRHNAIKKGTGGWFSFPTEGVQPSGGLEKKQGEDGMIELFKNDREFFGKSLSYARRIVTQSWDVTADASKYDKDGDEVDPNAGEDVSEELLGVLD